VFGSETVNGAGNGIGLQRYQRCNGKISILFGCTRERDLIPARANQEPISIVLRTIKLKEDMGLN
jgi:hypothetical protein